MKSAFLLEHSYEDGEYDIVTIIGVYSSEQKAKEAIEKFKNYSKFRAYPDRFNIDEYILDEDNWTEGFFIF